MGENEDSYEKFYSEQDETIDWTKEANGVIQDIARHAKEVKISDQLLPTDTAAFINLRTLEGIAVCVMLNHEGLQIVSDRFDCMDQQDPDSMRFETPYSLLSHISPAYVNSFGNCLAEALSKQLQDRLADNGIQVESDGFDLEDGK
ncbi:GSK3B-interacting protein [Topomyia yanbarensis]|uniref:GSK3B-interacting protein n=1 Tax=Topomyia yanbarensis TaxID=2498891 RepID=UPI00273C564B|nr:GSK3B-interacting protein [Topomyia yanbarensis]